LTNNGQLKIEISVNKVVKNNKKRVDEYNVGKGGFGGEIISG